MVWAIIIISLAAIAEVYYIFYLRRRLDGMAAEEIKKMEARRSGFISIISHQLRTPLSVINGYLEALLTGDQGPCNEAQKEYLRDALKINKNTVSLVNDYLKAVRLDSEKIPVNPQRFDLAESVQEIKDSLFLLARAHNCRIDFLPPAVQIPAVSADPIKIRQVIENILTNAIKYASGKGRVIITLAEKENGVLFQCRDNGVGIPDDEQAELFTKFFRAKNVLQKDTKGSGLGLYFAKMIIEALGGRIWLESKVGAGTTVYFLLPKYLEKKHEAKK